jgi:hypothetical protein
MSTYNWMMTLMTSSVIRKIPLNLVGKSIWNPAEFHDYSDSGPFELQNFHRNFIFSIIKCVPTNLEHVPSFLESSPAFDSSNFMNWKTFLQCVFFFWPTKLIFNCIPQVVDPTMLNCMDIGTIPGIAILCQFNIY